MALFATFLVIQCNHDKETIYINDYKTFTNVFGGYNNRGSFTSIKDIADDFFGVLKNFGNLDVQIFQQLDQSEASIFLEIFYADMNEIDSRGAIRLFNITGVKNGNFNRDTFSEDYNLPFNISNTAELKENSFIFKSMKIVNSNFKFITYEEDFRYVCRSWNYSRKYEFAFTNRVSFENEANVVVCDHFENRPKDYTLYVNRTLLILNGCSFLVNIMLLGSLIHNFISLYKYKSLKKEKEIKMKWIERNLDNDYIKSDSSKRQLISEINMYKHDDMTFDKTDQMNVFSLFFIAYVISSLCLFSTNAIIFMTLIRVDFMTSDFFTFMDTL